MRQKSVPEKEPATEVVKKIRRATRRRFSAEEKIRIVLEGLRGEDSIAELCRKEGINQNLYYRWSKEFLEAGKKRLAGDTAREATSDEVKQLKAEARQLKETLAEVLIENRLLKKSVLGDGENAEGGNVAIYYRSANGQTDRLSRRLSAPGEMPSSGEGQRIGRREIRLPASRPAALGPPAATLLPRRRAAI